MQLRFPLSLPHLPKLPLWFVSVLPISLQLAGGMGVVLYLGYASQHRVVDARVDRLMQESGDRVTRSLDATFAIPPLLAATHADSVALGQLNLRHLSELEPYLYRQLQRFPSVASIQVATLDGDAVGYRRLPDGSIGLAIAKSDTPGRRFLYRVDVQGRPIQLWRNQAYDLHQQPWYRMAQQGTSGWTSVYSTDQTASQGMAIAAVQPLQTGDGPIEGMVTVELELHPLNAVLRNSQPFPHGQIWIVEPSGTLIAASVAIDAETRTDASYNQLRVWADRGDLDPITQTVAQALLQKTGGASIDLLQRQRLTPTTPRGERIVVQIQPYSPVEGVNWLIVIAAPESDFFGSVRPMEPTFVWIYVSVLVLALGGSVAIARWSRLAMKRRQAKSTPIAQDASVPTAPTPIPVQELAGMSQSVQQMTHQLHQSLTLVQLALQETEAKFTTVFRVSPDPIVIVTLQEGRIIEANNSVLKFYGCSRDEVVGRTTIELGLWKDKIARQRFRQLLQQYGQVRSLEVEVCLKSSVTKTVMVCAEVCNLDGQDCAVLAIRDISDRKDLETALRASEAKLNGILNKASASIISFRVFRDRSWTYDYCSQGCEDVYGYTAEQMLTGIWWTRISQSDQQAILELAQESIVAGQPARIEYCFWHPDGSLRWIVSRITSNWDTANRCWNVIAVNVNITGRKRAETALRQSEHQLKVLTDALPALIAYSDTEQRYQLVNHGYELWFGRSRETFYGRTLRDVTGEAHYAKVIGYVEQVLAGQSVSYEVESVGQECDRFWAVNLVPDRDEQGQVRGYYTLITDITERKRAEAAVQQAKDAAEAANQAKSEFLANMNHELRSPLTAILGFTQVMSQDQSLNADQRQYLQIINRSGEHLLELINHVLNLSKIEAGRIEVEHRVFDLPDLLGLLRDLFHQQAQAKHLDFILDLAADLPQHVVGDAGKLRQVLINLLSNAIKFTQRGYVKLRVELLSDAEPLPEVDRSILLGFHVIDSGVGIAPENQAAIFEAFTQAHTDSLTPEGTGLGLTISRQFVQVMGGEMTVDSALGQGSIFSIRLPMYAVTGDEKSPTLLPNRPLQLLPRPSCRILVVDDQPENRTLLCTIIRRVGLEVKAVASGTEALRLWRQWHPHLIWMDLRMPGMTGYDVVRQIRQEESQQIGLTPTPIIALTAQASVSDRDQVLAAGFDDCMYKPFQEAELLMKLAEHLGLGVVDGEERSPQSAPAYPPPLPVSLTAEQLAIMPADWLSRLNRAAQSCNSEDMDDLIRQIPAAHSDMIHALTELHYNYRFDIIMKLTTPSR